MLRSHGLQPQLLHEVTGATALASLYASPSLWSFTSACDRESLLTNYGGVSSPRLSISSLWRLFTKVESSANNVLSHLLPSKKGPRYCLRPRSHPYELPYTRTHVFSYIECCAAIFTVKDTYGH